MTDHRTAPLPPHPPLPPSHRAPAGTMSRRALLQGTAVLGGALALGTALSSSAEPALAAGISRPDIVSASAWGALSPTRDLAWITRRPTHLVIHHTTHPNSTDFSDGAAHEVARLIQRNHIRRGWADTGQQFTIARGGQMLEGRRGSLAALADGSRFIEGAHAYGFNDESVGIEVDGMFMSALPTSAQWTSLVHLSAYVCERYGIPVDHIIAHRDVPGAHTLCCGHALYARLPDLRAAVQSALASGLDAGPGASRSYPTVRRGDSGDAVRRVQVTLTGIGHHPGAADGVFGRKTHEAVREYQSSIGTGVDGVVGARTWGALATAHAAGSTVRSGSSGTEVRYLQRGLNAAHRADIADDGAFGSRTEAAVRSYQSSRGLAADGIAGPNTWRALKHGR